MKLGPGNRIVKQYFVVVDKDDKVKKVCWAPLLWDIPNLGYRFTGFAGFTDWRIPKFLYVGPAMVSTGSQVKKWTVRQCRSR